jgi:hypothetical protein
MVNQIGEEKKENKKVAPSGQLFSHESRSKKKNKKIFPLFCFIFCFFMDGQVEPFTPSTHFSIPKKKGREQGDDYRGVGGGRYQHKQELGMKEKIRGG